MNIARVVPLRRFDPRHHWFDYIVPDGFKVNPGDLVTVPFRRREINGIVLEVVAETEIKDPQSIRRRRYDFPLVTAWQARLFRKIARWYGVSLGHLFAVAVPVLTKKNEPLPPGAPRAARFETAPTGNDYCWYRSRSEAIEYIGRWTESRRGQKLILCPTIEDAVRVHEALAMAQPALVTSRLTPAQYRRVYFDLLHGRIETVVGTARAIYLPFREDFHLLIDQEEHLAYVLDKQNPRLDVRTVLWRSGHLVTWTSSAPSIETYRRQPLALPSPPRSARLIGVLNTPLRIPWVSSEMEKLIEQADADSPLVAIIPRRVFGRNIRCQDCGYVVSCAACGMTLRYLTVKGSTVCCAACGRGQPLPDRCPQCRGRALTPTSFNQDTLAVNIKKHWPRLRLSQSWPPVSGSDLIFADYQVYQHLNFVRRLTAVAVINGDYLRSRPDLSVDETAWQYLHRLQSASPAALLVQTGVPDNDFWQRWNNGDDANWYRHEIEVRQRWKTPPFCEQLMATMAAPDPAGSVAKTVARIKRDHPGLNVQLIDHDQSPRILITAAAGVSLLDQLDPADYFPPPWSINPFVRSWRG